MRLDLTPVLRAMGNTQEVVAQVKMIFPLEELDVVGSVALDLHLTNTGELVLVQGTVEGQINLVCSRCGKLFKTLVQAEVEEEYRRSLPELTEEAEKELTEDDFIFAIQEDHTIDLTELVRQNLILSLPVKPLCAPDCLGPDLPKSSSEKQVDPRLSILRKLFPPKPSRTERK